VDSLPEASLACQEPPLAFLAQLCPLCRHHNIGLEEDIEKMISEFDAEMFRLHNEIDELKVTRRFA
jgi:hypothetical protein